MKIENTIGVAMYSISISHTRNVHDSLVGCVATRIDTPVAHGRTRRPLTQTELIKSRTHARGSPEHSKAQRRARARGGKHVLAPQCAGASARYIQVSIS